jgi:hypothetical protein
MNHYVKKSTDFISHGVRCSGDLYLPTDQKHPPVVVMGHGFAAEKCFRLPAYADPFSSLGGLGLKNTVMSIYAALRDGLRAITAREPYYIPVVGKSGDFAAIVSLGRQPTCFLPVIVVMRIWSNMQYYKHSLRMEQECEFRANYDKC